MAIHFPLSVKQLVKANFPQGFLEVLAAEMRAMYRETYEHALQRYVFPDYVNTGVHYDRWMRVDATVLMNVAQQFSLETLIRPNKARNCPHVEIHAGNVVLTASRVEDKDHPPRPACFRDSLAESNHMWLPGMEPKRPENGRYYLIAAHMPQEDNLGELGVLRLGAPAKDSKQYIDVMDVYAAAGTKPVAPEIITDQVKPKLRILKGGEGQDGA